MRWLLASYGITNHLTTKRFELAHDRIRVGSTKNEVLLILNEQLLEPTESSTGTLRVVVRRGFGDNLVMNLAFGTTDTVVYKEAFDTGLW